MKEHVQPGLDHFGVADVGTAAAVVVVVLGFAFFVVAVGAAAVVVVAVVPSTKLTKRIRDRKKSLYRGVYLTTSKSSKSHIFCMNFTFLNHYVISNLT